MKTKKTYIFCSFWVVFVNYSKNKNFSGKSGSVTFFYFLVSIVVKTFRIKLQTYIQTNEWIPTKSWIHRTSPAEDLVNIVVYAYSNILIAIYSVSYVGTAICNFSKMGDNAQKLIWKYKMFPLIWLHCFLLFIL